MRYHFLLLNILALATTSCVEMPGAQSDLVNKSLDIPARYDSTSPPVMEVRSGLLSIFSSSDLSRYVNKALKSNPDLEASAARLNESGFSLTQAGAVGKPTLSANAGVLRTKSLAGDRPFLTSRLNPTLDVQWELDIWGRIKAGVTASSRDYDAAAADYAAASESIAAQAMQAYFDLVAADKRLALSNRRLASFQKTFDLVDRRFESGAGDIAALDLARVDIENTKSQVAERKNARDQAVRNLAVITGSYPDSAAATSSWPSLKRGVRAGIPSDLLMNRPDIDAAYQRIRAADSRVKVAHRNLYPSFSLSASAGRNSSVLEDLLDSNFDVWSIVANMSAPLINGGDLRAEVGAANARAQQALANYRSTVLNAFREVENALGSERYLLAQQGATANALKASRSAEARVQRNYESGLVGILSLLETQRRAFDTEDDLTIIIQQRYKNRVSLALALGKGL